MRFRVTFDLDGSGVYYDPNEPIHLDALLAWVLAPLHLGHRHLTRDDEPEAVPLPLLRRRVNGIEVWCASALSPEGPTAEDTQHWRKRFRSGRADLSAGSPNLTNATYRDWNTPMPLLLARRMVGYGNGNAKEVRKLLRRGLTHLGKKRAYGHGKILDVRVEPWEHDWSHVRDGRATRWLPTPGAPRLVRPQPPYWNPHGLVPCCEVGDVVPQRRAA